MATIAWGVYAAVWITLEGNVAQTVLLAVGLALLTAGHLGQRGLGGRQLSRSQWLLVAMVTGLLTGLFSSLLTLIFMVVKTGLHAHGPEFTPDEMAWVVQQIPVWAAAGLLAGLGLGLLGVASGR
ncbi:MAG: hypothetical protein AB1791_21360 [Chloroflexota bacterium]